MFKSCLKKRFSTVLSTIKHSETNNNLTSSPKESNLLIKHSKTLHESKIFNEFKEFNNKSSGKLIHTYLKNMKLLYNYNDIIRDFFQALARDDSYYLNNICESSFKEQILSKVLEFRRAGFIIELESLKTILDYEILDYKFTKPNTTEDTSIFDNNKPINLTVDLKVNTPMKLVLFESDFSKKIYGKDKSTNINYLFKMQTQLSYTDLLWILPTANKGDRTRQSRILDFNNLMADKI